MSPHAMAVWSAAIWVARRNGPIIVVMRGPYRRPRTPRRRGRAAARRRACKRTALDPEVLAQRLHLALVVRADVVAVELVGLCEHALERELAHPLTLLDHERHVVRAHLERRARCRAADRRASSRTPDRRTPRSACAAHRSSDRTPSSPRRATAARARSPRRAAGRSARDRARSALALRSSLAPSSRRHDASRSRTCRGPAC